MLSFPLSPLEENTKSKHEEEALKRGMNRNACLNGITHSTVGHCSSEYTEAKWISRAARHLVLTMALK